MNDEQKRTIEDLQAAGLSRAKIAAEIGLSVNTVKSYIYRAEARKQRCKTCGEPLTSLPGHKAKTFCCDKCRYIWWNAHRDEMNSKTRIRRICDCCGKEFESYAGQRRKYCCHPCYVRSRYGVP